MLITLTFGSFLRLQHSPIINSAQAATYCKGGQIVIKKTQSGKSESLASGSTISIESEAKYEFSYVLYQTGTYFCYFTIGYSGPGEGSSTVINSFTGNHLGSKVIIKPNLGKYSLTIKLSDNKDMSNPQELTNSVTFSGGTTTTSVVDYKPKPDTIKVCVYPAGSKDSVRVYWDTAKEATSNISYQIKDGTESKVEFGTEYKAANLILKHYLTLGIDGRPKLKPDTEYSFQVCGVYDGKDYNSDTGVFKTGVSSAGCKSDGTVEPTTKDDTSTNVNTNTTLTGNPNSNINTGVTATFGDLDEPIGAFLNPLEKETLPEILGAILRILFALIGMIAVVIIIVAGFRMVLASGNTEELTKAKKAITWAIVGLIVSLMSFSIVAIIQRLIQG